MTCIVGLIDKKNKQLYMGGDSAGVAGLSITYRKDPKVFQRGPFLFGFTSSFRMGQLLMHGDFKVRRQRTDEDEYEYMVSAVVAAVRKLFEDGGWLRTHDGQDRGGEFLVGYKNRLFVIQSDFQVGENVHNYDACGCGDELALGSLYTTEKMDDITPEMRVLLSLESAEKFSAGVSRPFKILKLQNED